MCTGLKTTESKALKETKQKLQESWLFEGQSECHCTFLCGMSEQNDSTKAVLHISFLYPISYSYPYQELALRQWEQAWIRNYSQSFNFKRSLMLTYPTYITYVSHFEDNSSVLILFSCFLFLKTFSYSPGCPWVHDVAEDNLLLLFSCLHFLSTGSRFRPRVLVFFFPSF